MSDLGRPIRVVFFGGAFLEPTALELLARMEQHPEIHLVGGFCQSPGFSLRQRIASVMRRRGAMGLMVLGVAAGRAAIRMVRHPRAELVVRRRRRRSLARVVAAKDLHAPAVIARVRTFTPDLAVVYGAPLLRPELFEIPTFGTFGVHHGKLPAYRGVKTAFWAMFNGDATAGVTIQRINRGIDTGDIVCEAEIPIAGKRYGRVDAELHEIGVELFMQAILAVKRGDACYRTQERGGTRVYRQPSARDMITLWYRQYLGGQRVG
jgi:methionyl-tRNA formyltransferase